MDATEQTAHALGTIQTRILLQMLVSEDNLDPAHLFVQASQT